MSLAYINPTLPISVFQRTAKICSLNLQLKLRNRARPEIITQMAASMSRSGCRCPNTIAKVPTKHCCHVPTSPFSKENPDPVFKCSNVKFVGVPTRFQPTSVLRGVLLFEFRFEPQFKSCSFFFFLFLSLVLLTIKSLKAFILNGVNFKRSLR